MSIVSSDEEETSEYPSSQRSTIESNTERKVIPSIPLLIKNDAIDAKRQDENKNSDMATVPEDKIHTECVT